MFEKSQFNSTFNCLLAAKGILVLLFTNRLSFFGFVCFNFGVCRGVSFYCQQYGSFGPSEDFFIFLLTVIPENL